MVIGILTLIATLLAPVQHITVAAASSASAVKRGATVSLYVDVLPKQGIHVYAPGADGYQPITVKLQPSAVVAGKLAYPKSEVVTLADEKVSVFQKPFRLTQDVTLDKAAKPGSTVAVAGTVNFQACDDRVCYPPENAPVSWTVAVK